MHVVQSSKEYEDCGECQSCRGELVHAGSLAHATFRRGVQFQEALPKPSVPACAVFDFKVFQILPWLYSILIPWEQGGFAVVAATVSCKHASVEVAAATLDSSHAGRKTSRCE